MIERYTIKFAPAVSQKELEKALHESAPAQFQECDECRAKPGSPVLCEDCLSRRTEFIRTVQHSAALPDMTKMKVRIEIVGDFADLKKIAVMLKQMKEQQ